jgi:hypothetical protein
VDDRGRQVPDPVHVGQQLVWREETVVSEEVRFQPRQRQRVFRELTDQVGVGDEGRAAAFVFAPGACERDVHARIGIEQPPDVTAQHVAALAFGQHFNEFAPGFRVNVARPAEKPFHFARTAKKDAAQDETEAALRHGLAVGERQRAAPGASEQQPLADPEVLAQALEVLNQVLGGVACDLADRRRCAGPALVVQDDPEEVGVEEASMFRRAAAAWAAMQKHDRDAPRVAADLPVHRVNIVERQHSAVVRLDRSIKIGSGVHRPVPYSADDYAASSPAPPGGIGRLALTIALIR